MRPCNTFFARGRGFALALAVSTLVAAGGCDESPTPPGSLRFGQIGQVRIVLAVPLGVTGEGELRQTLTWSSAGPWRLDEVITYRGMVGDESTLRSGTNPEVLAGTYAQWIAQVNDVPSLQLFIQGLDPDLDPACGDPRTRMTMTIHDDARDEEISWTRCVDGTLSNLRPVGAGPDPAAGRLAAAAALVRDYTVGEGYLSDYRGSVPFGTVDRGEDSQAPLTGPRVIRVALDWQSFWVQHRGEVEQAPVVDFTRDMILVAAVGVREEAGDSVEIRRILPVDPGSFVETVLRVPGDFCSPASRSHVPFHIVVVPAVPEPIQFLEAEVERVPCGA